MSVIVVARITPKDGSLEAVLDALREISPAVHDEPGCELYATHTDGRMIVMVESWATAADLAAHGSAAPVARFLELVDGLLETEPDVWPLDEVPIGNPLKGVIQR